MAGPRALLALSLLVGCTLDKTTDLEASRQAAQADVSAAAAPGSFALRAPGAGATTGCDGYTSLALDQAAVLGRVAFLEERQAGDCTAPVAPRQRFYRLQAATSDCGIATYSGELDGEGARSSIEIVDGRAATCADGVPSGLRVTETRIDAQTGERRSITLESAGG